LLGKKEMVEESEWKRILNERIGIREELMWIKRAEGKPKLEMYLQHKKKLEEERYLGNPDYKGRTLMARLRSGTSDLVIETGRYENKKRKERICRLCRKGVEDEGHFLINSEFYKEIRKECLTNLELKEGDPKIKDVLLGSGNSEEIREAIKFIKRAFAKRKRILELIG
jgi:hypothetical protein